MNFWIPDVIEYQAETGISKKSDISSKDFPYIEEEEFLVEQEKQKKE